MEKYTFTQKTKLEAINEAKKTLVETENNLIIQEIKNNEEEVIISVIEKREVINFINDYLKKFLKELGYKEISIEIQNKDTTPLFTLYTENDGLLIGKNGKNLHSLQIFIQEVVKKELGESFKFIITISDYKEKREESLKTLAHNIAHEVQETKIEVKMDSMNSYERRIIHNALANNRYVYTKSEGIDPNRYVIVKPKEDK